LSVNYSSGSNMLRLFGIAALLLASVAASSGAQRDTLVITDVTVLPMLGPRTIDHQTVTIAAGRIVAVRSTGESPVPAGALVIDGRSKYLLPGLVDMHVHLSTPEEFPMFVGNGVLTVRDLNGSPETLTWRDAVADGRMFGPRLFVSGPIIAGADIPWRNKVTPTTAAAAEAVVLAQHAAGYDLIKIYDGLTKPVFDAAITTARRLGMLSTGHIPQAVGFDGVLASGMTGLEHLDKTVFSVNGHHLDTLKIPSIVARIKASGMWVTPTLESMIQLSLIGSGRYDSLLARPEAQDAPKPLRDFWNSVTVRLKADRPRNPGAVCNEWCEYQLRLGGALAAAGVPLLAGTDLPNAVLVPGYSLHGELRALVQAGLSPYQALEAATSAPARFFGQSSDWGTIAPGRRADLILVDRNPLKDLTVLACPAGVVLRGHWYGAEELTRFRRGLAPSAGVR
jgi:amidohydrolase family protein